MSWRLISAVAASAILFTAPAIAAEPDNAIKYRKKVMGAVGSSAGNIAAILKGEVEHKDQLGRLLAILAVATDADLTKSAFKQNTDGQGVEKTTATAKVWNDWDKFAKGLDDLAAAADAAADKGPGVTMDDMSTVFKACKSCHDDFRDK